MELRNIAIIAHVDHGKTTLVDGLLKHSGTLSAHHGEEENDRVMDSNDQERERGITITAKNTAVFWKDTRINIVDTPGHSDFGSEVERVLRMVDAVVLIVDAAEGPMPQTRFVLRKSLELGLKALVCINKIDRPDGRPNEVLNEVFDLFAALDANDEQLDFPVIYSSAREGWAVLDLADKDKEDKDFSPLFDFILEHVPQHHSDPEAPLQLQVATLDHSPFLGRIAIGRIYAGSIKRGMHAVVCRPDGYEEGFRVGQLMSFKGLKRIDIEEAYAGDIVALAGAGSATVGDTICPSTAVNPMPTIPIDPPTMSMTFAPNSSPFAGKEGKFVTSRQIKERLDRELLSNVGLTVSPGTSLEQFVVSGRGTLHLSVLIESMRREGYELSISSPEVILRTNEAGVVEEPIEEITIDCAEEFSGTVIEKLNTRGASLQDMMAGQDGHVRMRWLCPSQGLIGYRAEFLTDTRGTGTIAHVFDHYAPKVSHSRKRKNGVLIVQDDGDTVAYALNTLQDRGKLFVAAGEKVYHGQIIGLHSRENDLVVNPSKGKKLTNVRASGSDENIFLTPPIVYSLEEALEFIRPGELLEVTPTHIRLRKQYLDHNERKRSEKGLL